MFSNFLSPSRSLYTLEGYPLNPLCLIGILSSPTSPLEYLTPVTYYGAVWSSSKTAESTDQTITTAKTTGVAPARWSRVTCLPVKKNGVKLFHRLLPKKKVSFFVRPPRRCRVRGLSRDYVNALIQYSLPKRPAPPAASPRPANGPSLHTTFAFIVSPRAPHANYDLPHR
ncbi:hypothetical protein EVAR_81738_1 [Eumeta japonica]|uniref:Uncharacterized protein n=1 Tax=Eumeta variegata TaxID=151549 RepID=A0A4C1UID9_EUMVA|nr:hypothetical protein EVAR_81738_1 [Eumeta japonica]